MKCRALDENGDYLFGNNDQDYIAGVDAIAQTIRTKVLLFYGEWWENIGIGIPMFQSIIGQMNPEALQTSASLLLTQRIMEVEGVVSVDDVEIVRSGRTLNFRIKVNTEAGEATVEVAA